MIGIHQSLLLFVIDIGIQTHSHKLTATHQPAPPIPLRIVGFIGNNRIVGPL